MTVESGQDLAEQIAAAADSPGTRALGVWGGDGTVGTAAAAAVERSLPLLALPGGTLNHFARDAGIGSLRDALAAVTDGHAALADVGLVTAERGLATDPEVIRLTMLEYVQRGPLSQPGAAPRAAAAGPGKAAGRCGGHVPDVRCRDAHHA